MTDLTGLGASADKTTPMGVAAGIWLAKKEGYNIKYVVADTQTSFTATLSAAQQLVQQDHVNAVIAVAGLTLTAAPWMTAHGVPVIGAAQDGPEWVTSKNMFSVFGPLNSSLVTTTWGKIFKFLGATDIGSVGYGVSPISSETAQGVGVSVQSQGLKAGYINASFPYGGTNVAPVALAMKANGVDGFTGTIEPNTAFALLTALRQENDNPKVALLPTGYGGDLEQGGPAALQEAQGVYFLSAMEPVEMHTPATEQFQQALKAVGVTTDPTYAEYAGYASVALFVDALKAGPSNPSYSQLISTLSNIHNFTAAGLFGNLSLNMSQRSGIVNGVDNCLWLTKYENGTFDTVPGADPICGTIIPGKTVSAAS